MKNVFGINTLNQNDEKTVFDGEIFISDRINESLQAELDTVFNEAQTQQKKMKLPAPFTIIKFIFFIIGMIILGGIFKADVSIKEGFDNAPYLFYICIASLAVAGILQLIELSKQKKHLKSDSYDDFLQKSEAVEKRAMTTLGIKQDALSCDILFYSYKEKKDKTVKDGIADFLPVEMFVYSDNENFYIADCTCVFSFNRNEITEIKKVLKKATLTMWNKNEGVRSKKYKQFRMTQDKSGIVTIRDYYSICLNSRYGEYEILIPSYEIESVAGLIEMDYCV